MRTLDINECAELLKINRSTAFEMAQRGELPGAKIGRAWVFLEEDMVEYLRNKVRQQQQERQTAHLPAESLILNAEPIATYSRIRQYQKKRRTPIPALSED